MESHLPPDTGERVPP